MKVRFSRLKKRFFVGLCASFVACTWYLVAHNEYDVLFSERPFLGEIDDIESYLKHETQDLIHMKPPTFLPQFKNPCFYEKDASTRHKLEARLRCLPYFMLIGIEKCGTSDIFQSIVKHPDVILGKQKEPTFWNKCRTCKIYKNQDWCKICHDENKPTTFEEYLDFFQPLTSLLQKNSGGNISSNRPLVQITGEGNPSTIWDHVWWWAYPENKFDGNPPAILNAHYVKHFLPDVKLIITLRDPAERLYSNYAMRCRDNNIKESPEEFHSIHQEKIHLFKECLDKYSLRYCAYSLPSDTRRYGLFEKGLYVVYVQDWLKVFPREQFFIIQLEEFSKNKAQFMKRIYRFLGLRDVNLSFGIKTSPSHTRRMLNKTKTMLGNFYAPYNQELAKLLNDEKFLWR